MENAASKRRMPPGANFFTPADSLVSWGMRLGKVHVGAKHFVG